MSTIEIVSHCYGGDLTIYPNLLRAQGLSLINHSMHKCKVVWTICYNQKDAGVLAVLEELEAALYSRNVKIRRIILSLGGLFERAIGRNIAAMGSEADCVWFCDCDYLFNGRCLDCAIDEASIHNDTVVYPKFLYITTHARGDGIISKMEERQDLTIDDMSLFYVNTQNKAIGGIQIVSGDLARSRGYLHTMNKWQRPREDTSRGKFSTRSDVKFRSYIGTTASSSSIVGTHRIRHSKRSYGGEVVD